jgi:hypothetical protein
MEENVFNNMLYIDRMLSIGKDLLKFSLLLNSELLQFFMSLIDISNNTITKRKNDNLANKKADCHLEPADFYF